MPSPGHLPPTVGSKARPSPQHTCQGGDLVITCCKMWGSKGVFPLSPLLVTPLSEQNCQLAAPGLERAGTGSSATLVPLTGAQPGPEQLLPLEPGLIRSNPSGSTWASCPPARHPMDLSPSTYAISCPPLINKEETGGSASSPVQVMMAVGRCQCPMRQVPEQGQLLSLNHLPPPCPEQGPRLPSRVCVHRLKHLGAPPPAEPGALSRTGGAIPHSL